MKKTSIKFYVAALALSLGAPTVVHAATLDDVVKMIYVVGSSISSQIKSIVKATAETAADLIYEFNPSAPITLAGNVNIAEANKTSKATRDQMLQQSVTEQMTMLNPQAQALRTIMLRKLVSIQQAAPKPTGISPANIANLPGAPAKPEAGNVFSADSLVAPNGYSENQERNARDFINFISDAAEPLSKLTPQQIADIPNKETNQDYLEYQVALRSMIAARSVALNNFYNMYAERKVVPGLGAKVGLPDENGGIKKDASPMEVREYLAVRRMASPEWHKEMATASTHTLLNELVAIEAENRFEMHEMRKDIGRLIATLSVVELKTVKLEKLNLLQLESKLTQPAAMSKVLEPSEQDQTTLEKARELQEKLKQENPQNNQQQNQKSAPEQLLQRLQPQQ